MSIEHRVKKCIKDITGITDGTDSIKNEWVLVEDLGMDSLDAAQLLMELEEEFDCLDEIPQERVEAWRTVQDVVNYFTPRVV